MMKVYKQKKVLVVFSPCQGGGLEVSFKREASRLKVAKYLKSMGEESNGYAFFQHTEEVAGFFESPSLKAKLRMLGNGEEVTLAIDSWEALHLFGYDAHEGVDL